MLRIRNSEVDVWGVPLAASHSSSVEAWNDGLADLLLLRGDPIGVLAAAIDNDPDFALGRVVRVATSVLGGLPPDHPSVIADLAALEAVAIETAERERGHLRAARLLVAGNFSLAAAAWEDVIAVWPRDMAAIRFAHDVYLHIGDDRARLASSQRASRSFAVDEQAYGLVLGQLAFALEELGSYDAALEAATQALRLEPGDVWASHAAAHVHEMRDDSPALYELLDPAGMWVEHGLLASHLWWHRGIRLAADGRFDEALEVADQLPADGEAAFTLSDITSLLVRLETRGVDLGTRWDRVVDAWSKVTARHTVGFLELHASLAGLADPAFGADWLASQCSAHRPPVSQNDRLFIDLVEPLSSSVLALRGGGRDAALARLAELSSALGRIGGSLAQRQIIDIAAGVVLVPTPSIPETIE